MTKNAIEYTIRILLKRAFPAFADLIHVESNKAFYKDFCIEFFLIEDETLQELLKGTLIFDRIRSVVNNYDIPVILSDSDFIEVSDRYIKVKADIVTLSFYLLSRMEESLSEKRDTQGRFVYEESLAYKYNLIDIPVADEYALLLRHYWHKHFPGFDTGKNKFRIIPTHDIDFVRRFNGGIATLKTLIGGDLLLRKSIRLFFHSLGEAIKAWNNPLKDPEVLGIFELMELSRKYGLISEFYFMGTETVSSNYQYDVKSDFIKRIISSLKKENMIVGFHGDENSYNNSTIFERQKQQVEEASGFPIVQGRQHLLCFDAKTSPSVWEESQIQLDTTLGYSQHEGFMCGTCHPYPLYDILKDCELTVIEQPLIVMDCTLRSNRGVDQTTAYHRIMTLAQICQAVEGNFVILWHNSYVNRDWRGWYENVYVHFIETFSEK